MRVLGDVLVCIIILFCSRLASTSTPTCKGQFLASSFPVTFFSMAAIFSAEQQIVAAATGAAGTAGSGQPAAPFADFGVASSPGPAILGQLLF